MGYMGYGYDCGLCQDSIIFLKDIGSVILLFPNLYTKLRTTVSVLAFLNLLASNPHKKDSPVALPLRVVKDSEGDGLLMVSG